MNMRKVFYVMCMVLILAGAGIVTAQESNVRPWLGVSIADVEAGVQVQEVVPDSPADAAGIQQNDLIQTLNDEEIASAQALIDMLSAYAPDDTVTLGLERDGESLEVDVTLGIFPEQQPQDRGRGGRVDVIPREMSVFPMLGVIVNPTDTGWEVIEVLPFAEEQFQVGDVITAINGESIDDLDMRDFMGMMMDEDAAFEVTVQRGDEELTLTVEPMIDNLNMVIPGRAASRVVLGVQYHPIDEAFAANLNIDTTSGALITDVLPDSAAEAAGLMPGDVVTAVNDTPIDAENGLNDLLSEFESGDTVTLTVVRAGEEMEIEVTLQDLPDAVPFRNNDVPRFFLPEGGKSRFQFGVPGEGFDFELRQFGLEEFEGLLGQALPLNGEPFSVVCQDEDGNTVFSMQFRGRVTGEMLTIPGDVDFDSLTCTVQPGETAPDSEPVPEGVNPSVDS